MIREIRLYIEGGGDQKATRIRLRKGLNAFLDELRDHARKNRVRWQSITCGTRTATFDQYKTAVQQRPAAFNVLLVDAEGPVTSDSPWEHLGNRPDDRWKNPGVKDKHCHLMVQTMEAWLIADRERLQEYYGQHFHDKALPNNPNVEQIDKDTLEKTLKQATRHTQKGEYHKTRHAPAILERIRPDVVRRKAPFCDRLFRVLAEEMS